MLETTGKNVQNKEKGVESMSEKSLKLTKLYTSSIALQKYIQKKCAKTYHCSHFFDKESTTLFTGIFKARICKYNFSTNSTKHIIMYN